MVQGLCFLTGLHGYHSTGNVLTENNIIAYVKKKKKKGDQREIRKDLRPHQIDNDYLVVGLRMVFSRKEKAGFKSRNSFCIESWTAGFLFVEH